MNQNKLYFDVISQVVDAIREGETVEVPAIGWSMLPMVWHKRDKLILAPLEEDSIAVGNLLFVSLNSIHYVLHRVVDVEGDILILRGDGNVSQRERCRKSQVCAELVAVNRAGKLIKKGDASWLRFQKYWPRSPFLRRILLAFYRRVFIFKSLRLPKDLFA